MLITAVLERSDAGRAALKKMQGLTDDQRRVLASVDGKTSIARLIGDHGDLLQGDFLQAAQALAQRGLLHALSGREAAPQDENENIWAEARRATRSLEEKGFYTHMNTLVDASAEVATEGLHVLVVEDDEDIAELLTALLEDQGFIVTHAADAGPALEILQNGPALSLVLLDVVLPNSDGFDVLKRLRRYTRMHDVPVVMVTSRISDEDVVRGLKTGADGYIFKPFQWEVLYASIQGVIVGR